MRYRPDTHSRILHSQHFSFWSSTWKEEFCPEKQTKMAELINKLTTRVCLFCRYRHAEETQTPNFIRTLYFSGASWNLIESVVSGCFRSFMWHLWLCSSAPPEGKTRRMKTFPLQWRESENQSSDEEHLIFMFSVWYQKVVLDQKLFFNAHILSVCVNNVK